MRRILFFEDQQAAQFEPLATLRPVFELLCGHMSVRERVSLSLNPVSWGAYVRPHLAETYREEHPAARVNDLKWLDAGETLVVNGRWLPDTPALKAATSNSAVAGVVGDEVAFMTLTPQDAASLEGISAAGFAEGIKSVLATKQVIEAKGVMLHYPWDLITNNGMQTQKDFAARDRGPRKKIIDLSQIGLLGRPEDMFIDPTAELDPFVVIDARHGPVWIDANARIQAFTRIEGPSYIGPATQLFRANVREGCSFGPVCRLGGEIEESIIHSYTNKYHDGFLGHAYVGSWVNMGALTTNSDLKNDYSNVKVPLQGTPINTGSTKIGCFIGDHTKTALCSLFNTGSSVGIMSMLLPAGELLPKYIPPFTRLWHGQMERLDGIEATLASARSAMRRRDQSMTPAMENLIRGLYEKHVAQSLRD